MIYTAQDRHLRLKEMRRLAISRRGVCLSKRYVDSTTKLQWRCAEGHVWRAIPSSVQMGTWCEICAKKRVGRQKAHTIELMHKVAAERGGECLSTIYKNNLTKLRWRCKQGHEWQAVPASIIGTKHRKGSWCRICIGKLPKKLALQHLKDLAESRGGLLLSKRYKNSQSHLHWQCMKGHKWKAVPHHITKGSWCPVCAGSFPLNIDQMRKAARDFDGRCLSKKYINIDTHLRWRCVDGHEWTAKPYHVLTGHWCPTCSSGISERICRALLERMTGVLFPKTRPTWLRNERGRQMELDGYAQSLALAFEYQGYQHFNPVPYIGHNLEKLRQRQQDDERKRQLCLLHGVTLLEIRYDVPHHNLQEHLIEQLNGLTRGLIIDSNPVKIQELGVWRRKHLEEMRSIARAHGGKLLSKSYFNSETRLLWRCAEGHTWEAIPDSVKRGSWCRLCGIKRAAVKKLVHTIDEMQELAKAKGGLCLSVNYKGVETKLKWRCAMGHEWEAIPAGILTGKWCPTCGFEKGAALRRLSVEDMQQVAEKRGGECLSKCNVNGQAKFLWRCAQGHEWEAVSYSVRRGGWCPVCAGKRPKPISSA